MGEPFGGVRADLLEDAGGLGVLAPGDMGAGDVEAVTVPVAGNGEAGRGDLRRNAEGDVGAVLDDGVLGVDHGDGRGSEDLPGVVRRNDVAADAGGGHAGELEGIPGLAGAVVADGGGGHQDEAAAPGGEVV